MERPRPLPLEAAAGAIFLLLAAALLPATARSQGESTITRTTPPSLPAALPSPEPHEPLDAPLPVHQTRLSARLDPVAHTIQGEGEIRWTNRSERPVQEIYWHLYLNAFEHARTAFLRSRLGAGRGGQLPGTWGNLKLTRLTVRSPSEPATLARDVLPALAQHSPGDPEDRTDLLLPLPGPCAPGESLIFGVAFTSTLPTIVERTGYLDTFHMVGQWFPKPARLRKDGSWSHFPFLRLSEFDADFGGYDVTLEVPSGYTVGATGAQVEAREEAGWRKVRYVQEDVHDFAWTAWDRFRERELTLEGVKVRVLYPEGHGPSVTRQLDGLGVALRCMRRRLGPYPYGTLTVVQPPTGASEAGGMEYPTLITTGGPWSGPPLLRASETVTVHEFGHQYFYGLLASDEHRHPFLDEGVNTLVEGLCLREGYGDGSLLEAPGLSVDFFAGARWMALDAGHDHAVAHGAASFPTAGHYGRLVYFRAAILLATLRNAFGEDRFDGALSGYARAQRFRHPEPADLLAPFARVEPAMAAALDEGLHRRGWIDLAVVALQPTWTVIARRGTLRLPTEVRLRFADGSEKTERWDGDAEWIRFDVDGSPELRSVEVDPARKILLDEDWSNNARSLRPAALGLGTLERAAFWGGLLGHLLAP
jgi:hypothetical protein